MFQEISATYIYKRALAATGDPAYSYINLPHLVNSLNEALTMIHAQGFFREYTRHGPEHSLALVKSLDWLISDDQKPHLTDGDYLFLLLSCLLHDLGMTTNANEFVHRNLDEMARFTTRMSQEVSGREFLESIPVGYPYRDELIFEEFIRHNHAERISNAILGIDNPAVGDVSRTATILRPLFANMRGKSLSDLALICESHHRSDLHDTQKYQTESVHGQSPQAQINVQAVSILLRAADVLQIGSGRTPSIAFSLVNPSNPISYLQWTKEMGVTRVIGEVIPASDPSLAAEQHVVKLSGFFSEAEPFFALMNHVRYAITELRRCVSWSSQSAKNADSYRFRWSTIDTIGVEANSFERDQFSFQIDREKILNLLIGHTLYNDTRVVLRELVQNSLDAVRLSDYQNGTTSGHVSAHLDNKNRKLIITDNGTGMTAETITKHLLTVGSSYYSSEEFGREFPNFAPISRFGIGILTSFMVADEIEILTCHREEDKARRISINGPSGAYLMKIIDKRNVQGAFNGDDYGTVITLSVRANSRQIRLGQELIHWFGFPGCKLTATEDEGSSIRIGYSHPVEMLQEGLKRYLERDSFASRYFTYEVISEDELNLFESAYVVRTSTFSGKKSLVNASEFSRRAVEESDMSARTGIFLQGVRVETGSAGFHGDGPMAIFNGVGLSVPRTNVARSGIEQGEAQKRFFSSIYGVYIKFARENTQPVSVSANRSITRDGRDAFHAFRQFDRSQAADKDLLQAALDSEKSIVIEEGGVRKLVSRNEFAKNSVFLTLDSPFYRNAEALIEKLPHTKSLSDVIKALEMRDVPSPNGVLLCAPALHLNGREMQTLTISHVEYSTLSRQLVLTWTRVPEADETEMIFSYLVRRQQLFPYMPIIVAKKAVVETASEWAPDAVLVTDYCVIIHPAAPVIDIVRENFSDAGQKITYSKAEQYAIALSISDYLGRDRYSHVRSVDEVAREYSQRQSVVKYEFIKSVLEPFQQLRRIVIGDDDIE